MSKSIAKKCYYFLNIYFSAIITAISGLQSIKAICENHKDICQNFKADDDKRSLVDQFSFDAFIGSIFITLFTTMSLAFLATLIAKFCLVPYVTNYGLDDTHENYEKNQETFFSQKRLDCFSTQLEGALCFSFAFFLTLSASVCVLVSADVSSSDLDLDRFQNLTDAQTQQLSTLQGDLFTDMINTGMPPATLMFIPFALIAVCALWYESKQNHESTTNHTPLL